MNSAVANIKTIAKRELGAYFSSPLAYVFIVIFLLLCGFFTFMVGGFFERGEASLVRRFLSPTGVDCPLEPRVTSTTSRLSRMSAKRDREPGPHSRLCAPPPGPRQS